MWKKEESKGVVGMGVWMRDCGRGKGVEKKCSYIYSLLLNLMRTYMKKNKRLMCKETCEQKKTLKGEWELRCGWGVVEGGRGRGAH